MTADLEVGRQAGFWRSNAAINQVTVFALSGNLRAGSRVTLIGWP